MRGTRGGDGFQLDGILFRFVSSFSVLYRTEGSHVIETAHREQLSVFYRSSVVDRQQMTTKNSTTRIIKRY